MLKLEPYQDIGANWLAGGSRVLADQQRLGKTPQAIRAAHRAGAQHVQVISTASTVENWLREFDRWWPGGPLNVSATSYAKANRELGNAFPDILILDEAQKLKTPTSGRTVAIYGQDEGPLHIPGLADCAGLVWPLSGTIAPNDPTEWYTHIRMLAPDAVKSYRSGWITREQFQIRFCEYKNTRFGRRIMAVKNESELSDIIRSIALRRTRAEVWDQVPPMRFDDVPIRGEIPKTDNEDMERVRRVLEAEGLEGLRRISPQLATWRRLTGLAKVKPAAEWATERLEDEPDEKLVLFAYHREVIDGLTKALAKFKPAVVHGGTRNRQAEIDRFMTDPKCRVFHGQLTAAGEGVTIPIANTLAFVEASWVPGENDQAADRIVHKDKREPCLGLFLSLAGSADELIARAAARKAKLREKVSL